MKSMRAIVLGDDSRRRDLAKIHVAKKQLGMADDAYREMLWTLARVRSAGDLDHAGRKRVLDHLRACGFRRSRPGRHDPQAGKILALWLVLRDLGALDDASEHALEAYVHRQTGATSLKWLSSDQASKVIEALKSWQARVRRGSPEDLGGVCG